ncbi:unnamed protein product [Blepharisma stoltei]|uniref:Uncharacterized protein n=1 Tax=Blepharisma stoltei TaxID=1481888 RepID=A0AAU9IY55_9CILI|nr:unnamed protein product [Blepharisma stoltei]
MLSPDKESHSQNEPTPELYSPRPNSVEKDYNEQLTSLRNQYDQRLKSISSNIQMFLQELCGDDIFNAMRENPLSQDYALQRIEEMFEHSMNSEREVTIHRLTQELAEKDGYIVRLENDNKWLTSTCQDLEIKRKKEKIDTETASKNAKELNEELEETKRKLADTLKRKEKEWNEKLDELIRSKSQTFQSPSAQSKQEMENLLKEKDREIREIKQELEKYLQQVKFPNKNLDMQNQLERIKFENERLKEMNENLKREVNEAVLQSQSYQQRYEQEIYKFDKLKEELLEDFKRKLKKFKQKIVSQKEKIGNLRIEAEKFSEKENELKREIEKMKMETQNAKYDAQEKIRQIIAEYNKKEIEITDELQGKIEATKNHYTQLIAKKELESRQELDLEISKIQDAQKSAKIAYESKINNYESNFISKNLFSQLLEEKEKLLTRDFKAKTENLTWDFSKKEEENANLIEKLRIENENLRVKVENNKEMTKKMGESFSKRLNDPWNNETLENYPRSPIRKSPDFEKINELETLLEISNQKVRQTQDKYEEILSNMVEKSSLIESQAIINNLQSAISNKEKTIIRLEAELSMMEDTLKELAKENKEILAKQAHIKNELNNKSIESVKGEIKKLKEALASKIKENSELKNEMKRLDNFCFEVTTKNRSYLENSKHKAKLDILALKRELKQLRQTFEFEFMVFVKNLSRTFGEIHNKLKDTQNRSKSVSFRKIATAIDPNNQELMQYCNDELSLISIIKNKISQKNDISVDFNKIRSEYENLVRENKILKKNISLKSSDIDALQKEATKITMLMKSEYEKKVKKIKEKYTKEISSLKAQIKSLNDNKEGLESQLENIKIDHSEELENLKTDLEFKIDCLQQEITRLTNTPSPEFPQKEVSFLKKKVTDLERNLLREQSQKSQILRNKSDEIQNLNQTIDKLSKVIEEKSIEDTFSTRRSLEATLSPKY